MDGIIDPPVRSPEVSKIQISEVEKLENKTLKEPSREISEIVEEEEETEDKTKIENFKEPLLKSLQEVLQIPGMKGEENEILDYLEKHITSIEPKLEYHRDENIGIFVIIPSKCETPKRCILFDANVDTVSQLKNEVVIVSPDDHLSNKECIPEIICSERSSLDNRVSVAILLEMVKKVRYSETLYVALFSTNKNWGQRASGASFFSDSIDLTSSSYGRIHLQQIIVLDVYTRCIRSVSIPFTSSMFVIFGSGFVPIKQSVPSNDHEYFTYGNNVAFSNGKYTRHIDCTKISCPVFTGSKNSYLSLSDFFGMYEFIAVTFDLGTPSTLESRLNSENRYVRKGREEDIPEIQKMKYNPLVSDDLKINPKNEQEEYLLSTLLHILEIHGPSEREAEVLDFVKNEVYKFNKKDDIIELNILTLEEEGKGGKDHLNKIRMISDYANYGLLVILPSKTPNPERLVLFDAHIDTVKDEYIKPYLFEMEMPFKGSQARRQQIIATGLDNRINCALLISMMRFTRFEDTQFAVLFSVQEEIGCLGAEFFSNFVDIRKISGVDNLEGVVVLDVSRSKFPEVISEKLENSAPEKYYPLVGGGVVPIDQPFHDYDFMYRCNSRRFIAGELTKDVLTMRLSICCTNMHFRESFASVSDLYDFYSWMNLQFEDYWVKKKFQGESHVHVPDILLGQERKRNEIDPNLCNLVQLEVSEKTKLGEFVELVTQHPRFQTQQLKDPTIYRAKGDYIWNMKIAFFKAKSEENANKTMKELGVEDGEQLMVVGSEVLGRQSVIIILRYQKGVVVREEEENEGEEDEN